MRENQLIIVPLIGFQVVKTSSGKCSPLPQSFTVLRGDSEMLIALKRLRTTFFSVGLF